MQFWSLCTKQGRDRNQARSPSEIALTTSEK
jgi:hypothetical protein